MTNISSKIILKTYPNPLPIFFGIIGTLFFGTFAVWMYNSQFSMTNKIDEISEKILYFLFLGAFVFFSLWSSTLVLKFKLVTLTDQYLIIKQPMLFLKRIIPLNNISIIKEEDFNVNPEVKNSIYKIHNGKQSIVKLTNGKKIKLNSFEILEYEELIRKLFVAKNRANKNSDSIIKNEGWGILIIISIITFGLILSVIFK